MAQKITKANGHIVQADWLQTDPSKMDYIHNKPEIPTAVTDEHIANIANMQFFGLGEYTEDLDFIYDTETKSWNKDPCKTYWGTKDISLTIDYSVWAMSSTVNWWVVKGEMIAETSYMPYVKQTLYVGATEFTWYRYHSPDRNGWSHWMMDLRRQLPYLPSTGELPQGTYLDSIVCTGGGLSNVGPVYGMETGLIGAISNVMPGYSFGVAIRDAQGDIEVPETPGKLNGAASKGYVDRLNKTKISTKQVSVQIKPTDLDITLDPDGIPYMNYCTFKSLSNKGIGYDIDPAFPITIDVISHPENSFFTDLTSAGTVISAMGTGGPAHPLIVHTGTEWNVSTPVTYYTFGGPPDDEIIIMIGVSDSNYRFQKEQVADFLQWCSEFTFSVRFTPRGAADEDLSLLSVDLYSDTELEYRVPITELTINNFISCEGHIDEWTISFIAGDEDPLVIIPDNIKWAIAEPVFEANKKYLITFKKIIGAYVGIWTVIS